MLEDNRRTTQDEQANSGSQEADAVINLFLPQSFSWKARWEAASAFQLTTEHLMLINDLV